MSPSSALRRPRLLQVPARRPPVAAPRHSTRVRAGAAPEGEGSSRDARPGVGLSQEEVATPSGSGSTTATVKPTSTDPEVDRLMDSVSFGQLCDEFECISSPSVERTARQLARDILDIREDCRLLSSFGVFVKYKDPLRSFTGREKYKRPSWIKNALDDPQVVVLQMVMRTTSELTIRWRVQGKPRLPPASLVAGPLLLTITSTFVLNQISGQVVEHRDEWDLSGSSVPGAAYFWSSRLAWTVAEQGRDASEAMKGAARLLDQGRDEGANIYPDPSGDPRKFFQQDNPNSELYQIGLVIALLYLLVQFLRFTL
eukprot:SM000011S19123  [mRNA]  locus=s11:994272:995935:+ [translate_table: standard]